MGSKIDLTRNGHQKVGPSLVSMRMGVSPNEIDVLDLLCRMAPQDRRVVAAVVARVIEVEARLGQEAALDLIDDIEAVIRAPRAGKLS
jgi:hypothetical protein